MYRLRIFPQIKGLHFTLSIKSIKDCYKGVLKHVNILTKIYYPKILLLLLMPYAHVLRHKVPLCA